MDFTIPQEFEQIVGSVRSFRERELMPYEHQFLIDGHLPFEKKVELQEKGREKGFWALEVPESYGGAELNTVGCCLVAEELNKFPGMFDFGGNPQPSLYACDEDQIERYLLPVVRGEKRDAFAFTEPAAGSDLARLETTAKRSGDGWVLNGTKTFISHADEADFVVLYATTDRGLGHKGVTAFIVDKETPGFSLSRPIPTMGDGWEPYELAFQECIVSDAHRLGEVGGAWKLAENALTHGRLKIAAMNLGIARRCIDLAAEWAQQRITWGKPLAARQSIQWMLADSEVELQAARLLVLQAAWMDDNGKTIRNEAFGAKLYATEMAQRVTDRCLQIFGGLGYTRELPIQSFFRQVRLWRIGHGTSEIMRWMIARNMLGKSALD